MSGNFTRVGEPHGAHRAAARLLAGVGPLVRGNVALVAEPLGALRAGVRLLAGVRSIRRALLLSLNRTWDKSALLMLACVGLGAHRAARQGRAHEYKARHLGAFRQKGCIAIRALGLLHNSAMWITPAVWTTPDAAVPPSCPPFFSCFECCVLWVQGGLAPMCDNASKTGVCV